jgi:hypothetical protein
MHEEGHQPMQSWIVLGNAHLMMTSMQVTLHNAYLLAAVFARNTAARNALL